MFCFGNDELRFMSRPSSSRNQKETSERFDDLFYSSAVSVLSTSILGIWTRNTAQRFKTEPHYGVVIEQFGTCFLIFQSPQVDLENRTISAILVTIYPLSFSSWRDVMYIPRTWSLGSGVNWNLGFWLKYRRSNILRQKIDLKMNS